MKRGHRGPFVFTNVISFSDTLSVDRVRVLELVKFCLMYGLDIFKCTVFFSCFIVFFFIVLVESIHYLDREHGRGRLTGNTKVKVIAEWSVLYPGIILVFFISEKRSSDTRK
jgi:hypothetical protein